MMDLIKEIEAFVKASSAAPAQKSAEWYALKSKTIGGSEVATVLGLNPYKSVKSLIAEKAGVSESEFNGNIATRWGNVFERVTRDWAELVLLMDNKIVETGSLPGIIDRQRYSPDGLGVVVLIDEDGDESKYIILFEFKSPFRSIPDGKIPKHYRPQIQTGMLTIPIVDISIFINNCYRKCALKDIGFNMKYDTIFHDGDLKKRLTKAQKITSVFGCGIIGLYQTKVDYDNAVKQFGYGSDSESDVEYDSESHNLQMTSSLSSSEYDMQILMDSVEEMIDFGREKSRIMDRLFELIEENRVKVFYFPIIPNQEIINEMEFIQVHKKNKTPIAINPKKLIQAYLLSFLSTCDTNEWIPVGYLPWKLIKSDIIDDSRDENWKQIIEGPIKSTLNSIDTITSSEDPQSEFYKIFPQSKPEYDEDVLEGFNGLVADDDEIDVTETS